MRVGGVNVDLFVALEKKSMYTSCVMLETLVSRVAVVISGLHQEAIVPSINRHHGHPTLPCLPDIARDYDGSGHAGRRPLIRTRAHHDLASKP